MKDVILFISLAINILILGALGWFGFKAYATFKSAMSTSGSSPISANVIDVIEVNDAGYKARFYIVDKAGDKIVLNEFNTAVPAKKSGDVIKFHAYKNSVGGINSITYAIVP